MPSPTLQWAAGDTAVAGVSPAGLVTARRPGSTTVTAAAAGVSGSAVVTVVHWPVASISLDPDSLRITTVSGTAKVTAIPLDSAGQALDAAPVAWTSSAPEIVSVAPNGEVTAEGEGEATVTATAGEVAADVRVVVDFLVAGMSLAEDSIGFDALGDSVGLLLTAFDSTGAVIPDPEVGWSTRDASVVDVSGGGVLRPEAPGTTWVIAVVKEHEDSVKVVVDPTPSAVSVAPDTVRLHYVGARGSTSATVTDRTDVPLPWVTPTWTSTDSSVVVVEATEGGQARITAAGPGSASVVATSGELSAAVTVVVNQVPADLRITPPFLSFFSLESTQQLTAVVLDSGEVAIADPPVTWASRDAAVATVDAGGAVTSHSLGTTEITATSAALERTVEVTVAERPARLILSTDSAVTAQSEFEVVVTLDMEGRSARAGAVAVEVTFDPALVQSVEGTTASSLWASLRNNVTGFYRIVVSQPSGLTASGVVATLRFRAVGAPGSEVTFDGRIIQVVAAGSYEDISGIVLPEGASSRIR